MPGSLERAASALSSCGLEVRLVEPMAAALVRAERALTGKFSFGPLVEHWASRSLGTALGSDRYRWELTHARGTGLPTYAGTPTSWKAWRPSEQDVLDHAPFEFEERLIGPIATCESAELLAEASSLHPRAAELLEEAEPVLRRDVAACALERNVWADTFFIWCLTRCPETFERVRPLAAAVVESYALRAQHKDGVVVGTRFPFHGRPLVSATAQLGTAILQLGSHIEIAARAIGFAAGELRADGGFGDRDEPSELLTTLVAADLLASTSPAYDPEPTRAFLFARQDTSGLWRAFGPEAPWLTFQLLKLAERLGLPFAERFRFPHAPSANRDRKTTLPFFAYFTELARLFSALPELGSAPLATAFIDLIGFREFNNRYGQSLGDQVLREFALALGELPQAVAVRDGGDEFLLLGAPLGTRLFTDLDALRQRWPARFRARFGADAPAVLARVVCGSVAAGRIIEAREKLGRAIGELKHAPVDPQLGVSRSLDLAE